MRVVAGAVRVTKRVVREPRSLDVSVAYEELVVERHPVRHGARGGPLGTTERIVIPLAREDVHVATETYVTEEVQIGTRAITKTERVSATLLREELVVTDDFDDAARERDPRA